MIPNSSEKQLLFEIEKLQNLRRQLISFLNQIEDLMISQNLLKTRSIPSRKDRFVMSITEVRNGKPHFTSNEVEIDLRDKEK